jgi:hypothetical protein
MSRSATSHAPWWSCSETDALRGLWVLQVNPEGRAAVHSVVRSVNNSARLLEGVLNSERGRPPIDQLLVSGAFSFDKALKVGAELRTSGRAPQRSGGACPLGVFCAAAWWVGPAHPTTPPPNPCRWTRPSWTATAARSAPLMMTVTRRSRPPAQPQVCGGSRRAENLSVMLSWRLLAACACAPAWLPTPMGGMPSTQRDHACLCCRRPQRQARQPAQQAPAQRIAAIDQRQHGRQLRAHPAMATPRGQPIASGQSPPGRGAQSCWVGRGGPGRAWRWG